MIYGMGEVLIHTGSADSSSPSLPSFLCPPANPSAKPRLYKDFFMVTEFTEDVGPVPLRDYIIPDREEIEKERAFTLDDFSIKIMSADYFVQAANQASSFRMPEDMSALISNARTSCYTLLYAFTLYDVHGRGYVRPLYLAYTCCVREKIVSMYTLLNQAISKAVHRLVHCNIRKFADELELCMDIQPTEQLTQDEVPYINIVQDTVNSKLAMLGDCCSLLIPTKSRSGSVTSDWGMVNIKGEGELRPVTDLSDYWPEFQQDLYKIYKMFSQNSSQIMQCLREERLACDTFNSLNMGGTTFALLKSHKSHESRSHSSLEHKPSITSIGSSPSVASLVSRQSSLITSPNTADRFIMEDTSLGSNEFVSDPGVNSLNSNTDATSINSEGAVGFAFDQNSMDQDGSVREGGDYCSVSTDSLLSRNDSMDSSGQPDSGLMSESSTKLLGYNLSLDVKHTDLRSFISHHREHVRDLIYSVMTSRPVVLIEHIKGSRESDHEKIARALTSFIPFQHRARTNCGFHIVKELNLKSICTLPITCFVTSNKSEKISDNVKTYASIYHINNKAYEGLQYCKDSRNKKSRGLLDLFYRKRKHMFPYFSYKIESQLMGLATKAQLLHSILQSKLRINDSELMEKLSLKHPSDLNIIKNLVHVVLKQQYVSSQGLKEEDISAMTLMLTIS